MHSPHNHRVIRMFVTAEEIEQQLPHVVQHDIRLSSDKWRQMVKWLRATVGEPEHTWGWQVSDQLRFRHESDAILFSVTWS